MSSTSALTVLGDFSMDESTVNIHPNDGFDLGLMTTDHAVDIHVGPEHDPASIDESGFRRGTLFLKNEVRQGHIELSLKSSERLGSSKQAVVHYFPDDQCGKLLIIPV